VMVSPWCPAQDPVTGRAVTAPSAMTVRRPRGDEEVDVDHHGPDHGDPHAGVRAMEQVMQIQSAAPGGSRRSADADPPGDDVRRLPGRDALRRLSPGEAVPGHPR
jgi:hypothetical protein